VVHSIRSYFAVSAALLISSAALAAPKPASRTQAPQAGANDVAFVRPGIVVKIKSAAVAADGTITARFTLADPKGLPLDKDGIQTPGVVTLGLIAVYIPAGKTQYVSYTTTTLAASINTNPAQIQAGNDSGGTYKQNADGDYTYTFRTKAPANFDATATHAIGISARRDLTEFLTYGEVEMTSNDVFTFVPNGSAVKVVRDVVPTSACNKCHNPLFAHGGSRVAVELCITCHTPQTVNPDTLLTMDMPVLIHKLHTGKNLASVKAGTPYRIWHRGAWTDFSEVGFPQDLRNCTTCHAAGPKQADNWKTNPTRAACGACHESVNFATGEGHVNLAQRDDSQCKNCHTPDAINDFDASVTGAHVIPNNSKALPGLVTKVLKVENAVPGQSPAVTFQVTDRAGVPVDISKITQIRVVLSGPNVDYQAGATGVRASEDPSKTPGKDGVYTYTTIAKIPAGATGSYTASIQARNSVTLQPGTKKEVVATDAAVPTRMYFTVDKSSVVARRQVVSNAKCMACHNDLKFVHGGTRNDVQECVICHNPTLVDSSKATANFAYQIHATHRGNGLENPYVLANVNYQEVGFPGEIGDCNTCHINNSQQVERIGAVAPVATPGLLTATTQPVAAACLGCHDTKAASVHAQANTNTYGESCSVCHGSTSEFSVDRAHARIKSK
jgi:OmcA/MtrC family decaheme c-type cytochrome